MPLTLHLTDEIERRLRERASREGRPVEAYVLDLIERHAATTPAPGIGMVLPDDEFELLLGGLSSGPALPHLPADFSRDDIYADHD
jgi:hypothetical protein